MLSKRAETLHLGVANYCWFTDHKALCLRLTGTQDAEKPLIGMCDSARCRLRAIDRAQDGFVP